MSTLRARRATTVTTSARVRGEVLPATGRFGSTARVRGELRVVEGREKRQILGRVLVGIVTLSFFGALLALAGLHAVLVQEQTRIEEIGVRMESAREEIARLEVEVARLSSPSRIRDSAARLGMVPPREVVPIVAVDDLRDGADSASSGVREPEGGTRAVAGEGLVGEEVASAQVPVDVSHRTADGGR